MVSETSSDLVPWEFNNWWSLRWTWSCMSISALGRSCKASPNLWYSSRSFTPIGSTMPKEDIDLPDLSKLSGTIPSNAFHALVEVKQMRSLAPWICAGIAFSNGSLTYFSNQVMSPPDVNLPDWSKLSGAVLSRASDALEEVKQLRFFVLWLYMTRIDAVHTILSNQTMSKKDLPNIDWSKVSRDILTSASDALTETKKLVYVICLLIIMPWLMGLTHTF